jgi:pseudouridine synthase
MEEQFPQGIRLQKWIAQAGVASRRSAEEMIRAGRVRVNGAVVRDLGVRVDPERDEVRVDGEIRGRRGPQVTVLFHKPGRCVTTLHDPEGRRTVADFVRGLPVRVFPVGRLDYDATGLLVLTSDGELAHRLQHPRYGVAKSYEVKLKGRPHAAALATLRTGVELEEGRTAPAEVAVIKRLAAATWVSLVLHQGWYRQIKRMCAAVGHPVLKIKRVAYGPLRLGSLPQGTYRLLTAKEREALWLAVGGEAAAAPRGR